MLDYGTYESGPSVPGHLLRSQVVHSIGMSSDCRFQLGQRAPGSIARS